MTWILEIFTLIFRILTPLKYNSYKACLCIIYTKNKILTYTNSLTEQSIRDKSKNTNILKKKHKRNEINNVTPTWAVISIEGRDGEGIIGAIDCQSLPDLDLHKQGLVICARWSIIESWKAADLHLQHRLRPVWEPKLRREAKGLGLFPATPSLS